ncbi:hypothetical protein GOBAR_AA23364 [Gossypium barbadense]|uniref:Leucine-rich repeat-containing N-terminal plant-type domain-containing protein n=1 Tax=Gossypium barbadense TaxID=3634 RepID=A0A2P5X1V6_GOSBA|nr:hypothetical protein GOBAR_AA23364 [Gossypium barbadense]
MTTPLPISLFHFLLLIAAVCFTICHANSNVRCIHSESEALLKFKNDLIDPSNSLSSWVEGGDCCEWSGVVCHNSTGHVHKLHLAAPLSPYEQSALRGKINPSLLELEHLSFLDLGNNNFSSIHIPKFLGMLVNLMYLNLSFARFQGEIPHNLGNLTKLQYLDLRSNERGDNKATSLQWISGLSSLQYLDLSESDLSKATNWLQEDDPSSISVNSSKSLLVLDLSGNSLSSVSKSIFSLHGLVSIDLRSCSLEGTIPDYFGNISFLEVLDLSLNHLNSSIPNSLYSLNHLRFLDLSYNEIEQDISEILQENLLSGQIPLSIGELSSLKFFDVTDNQLNAKNNLTGKIPPTLGYTNPCMLNLRNNSMFGKLPSTLQNSSRLFMLDLSENHFSGSVPAWIGDKLSKLVVLSLRSNNFDGHIPRKICDLQFLQILDLAHNNISGVIPKCFNNLSAMVTTNKTNSKLSSWYFVDSLIYLKELLMLKGREDEYGTTLGLVTSMDLSVYRLKREIPKEIGQIPTSTQLQSFENLSYVGNHLCGPPLTKNCTSKSIPTNGANNRRNSEGSKVNWLYWLPCFSLGLGGLHTIKSWTISMLSFQRTGRSNGSQEEFEQAILTSTTVYIGNMCFYSIEERVYELFSTSGIILGKMQRMLLNTLVGQSLIPVRFV